MRMQRHGGISHTSMSLEASKNGNIVKAKEHARKAQACRQNVNNLLSKSDNLIDGELEQVVQIVDPEFWTSNMKSENKN